LVYWTTISQPILTDAVGNDDGSCGGGAQSNAGYEIVARDSQGNTATADVFYSLSVWRWDNTNIADSALPGSWSYTGSWSVSHCLCADGGTQTYTTGKGASATYRVTVVAGTRVALMMAEGPGRGSFTVAQDGTVRATVSTHTSANANRVLTWTSGPLTAGTHTFRIVNLATKGHPRLDVNAALATCPGALAGGECPRT
jgi:hypothetical protein